MDEKVIQEAKKYGELQAEAQRKNDVALVNFYKRQFQNFRSLRSMNMDEVRKLNEAMQEGYKEYMAQYPRKGWF